MSFSKYNDHTSPLFKDLCILKFTDVIYYLNCIFLYKYHLNEQLNGFRHSFSSICFSRKSGHSPCHSSVANCGSQMLLSVADQPIKCFTGRIPRIREPKRLGSPLTKCSLMFILNGIKLWDTISSGPNLQTLG